MFIGGKTLFAALIILVFALIGILVRVLRDRVVAKRAREHMELERLRNANKAPEFPSGIMDDIGENNVVIKSRTNGNKRKYGRSDMRYLRPSRGYGL